jgi:hypothetical protein
MHANMLVFSLRQKDERDSLRSNSEEDGCRSSFSLTYVFVQEQLDDGDLGGLRDGLPATVWSFGHQAGRTADGVSELRWRFGCLAKDDEVQRRRWRRLLLRELGDAGCQGARAQEE